MTFVERLRADIEDAHIKVASWAGRPLAIMIAGLGYRLVPEIHVKVLEQVYEKFDASERSSSPREDGGK